MFVMGESRTLNLIDILCVDDGVNDVCVIAMDEWRRKDLLNAQRLREHLFTIPDCWLYIATILISSLFCAKSIVNTYNLDRISSTIRAKAIYVGRPLLRLMKMLIVSQQL